MSILDMALGFEKTSHFEVFRWIWFRQEILRHLQRRGAQPRAVQRARPLWHDDGGRSGGGGQCWHHLEPRGGAGRTHQVARFSRPDTRHWCPSWLVCLKNRGPWFRWGLFHLPGPSIFPKGHLCTQGGGKWSPRSCDTRKKGPKDTFPPREGGDSQTYHRSGENPLDPTTLPPEPQFGG